MAGADVPAGRRGFPEEEGEEPGARVEEGIIDVVMIVVDPDGRVEVEVVSIGVGAAEETTSVFVEGLPLTPKPVIC